MYVTLHVGLPIESGRGHVTTCFLWECCPPKASNYDKESGYWPPLSFKRPYELGLVFGAAGSERGS